MNKTKRIVLLLRWIFLAMLFVFAFAAPFGVRWYFNSFTITVEEILYTINLPTTGADTGFLWDLVREMVPGAIWGLAAYTFVAVVHFGIFSKVEPVVTLRLRRNHRISLAKLLHLSVVAACLVLVSISLWDTAKAMKLPEFLRSRKVETHIYEEYYRDPKSVELKSPAKKKNLIYLYIESLETTYLSREEGGAQDENLMPRLTELAKGNINFSNNQAVGGWHVLSGSGWTMGALFSTQTGLPFAFPVTNNGMNRYQNFAPGVTSLGQLLQKEGYTQEFLCGSEGEFAGRSIFFTQHGDYRIYDYTYAMEVGDIPQGYRVAWGFEDAKLYEIAKKELLRLASEGKPFNLTFLTVDPHHVGGNLCRLCGDKYETPLANVIACTDSQAADFLEWCSQQDFYEDTVIVVTGDHPRMDSILVDGVDSYHRTVYNLFLNAEAGTAETKNREFGAVDMLPTILHALGYEIPGNRLGMGTDLFSDTPTLMEELGYEYLNGEFGKRSKFYNATFGEAR